MNNLLMRMGHSMQSIFLLCVRLFWGWEFFWAGFGKFADMQAIAAYFGTIGIPYPLLNAYTAASVEMIGGICMMVGFASRLVSIPLAFTMIIALITAHYEATIAIFDNPLAFVGQGPFSFLFAAVIIFIFGPGKFSIDREKFYIP